jgi:hypothetical protein
MSEATSRGDKMRRWCWDTTAGICQFVAIVCPLIARHDSAFGLAVVLNGLAVTVAMIAGYMVGKLESQGETR